MAETPRYLEIVTGQSHITDGKITFDFRNNSIPKFKVSEDAHMTFNLHPEQMSSGITLIIATNKRTFGDGVLLFSRQPHEDQSEESIPAETVTFFHFSPERRPEIRERIQEEEQYHFANDRRGVLVFSQGQLANMSDHGYFLQIASDEIRDFNGGTIFPYEVTTKSGTAINQDLREKRRKSSDLVFTATRRRRTVRVPITGNSLVL